MLKRTYISRYNQSGALVPTAEVFKNTIGNGVWSRPSIGLYEFTSIGAFGAGTTTLPINYTVMNSDGTVVHLIGQTISDNVYQISCVDSSYTEIDLHAIITLKIEQFVD